MKAAYSYIRFSSLPQEKGDSVRRQSSLPLGWIERNPGYYLDSSTYRDLGVSAWKGKNRTEGALAAFIQAVESGKVKKGSALLVESLDRLSREQVEEALELFLKIIRLGITIVTLGDPETKFIKGELDMTKLIMAIIVMSRAYEESARKSERVGKAWAQKRANIHEKKLTRLCPAWLELSKDKTHFSEIPAKVAIVKRIFRMTIEGMGATVIERKFNVEKVPPLGTRKNSTKWHKSYIEKILTSPAVYGEYQPHVGKAGPDRKPIGNPVENYFPVVVPKKDFDRAQAARAGRRIATGPSSTKIANLFTGIAKDARDKSNMVRVDKGDNLIYLVSGAAHRGEVGGYITFPYRAFERAILRYLGELKADDILPDSNTRNALRDELEALEGKLDGVAKRIAKATKELDEGGDFDALVGLLRKWENDKEVLMTERDKIRRELAVSEANPLKDTQKTLDLLDQAKGDDIYELRQRAKQQIRNLVQEIWVLTYVTDEGKACDVQIHFRAGGVRYLFCINEKGRLIMGFDVKAVSAAPDTYNLRTWKPGEIILGEGIKLARDSMPTGK